MDNREYRHHYMNVLPEENNKIVWDFISTMNNNYENNNIYGQLEYAVGKSNNDGGDSHHNPNLPKIVCDLSKQFPDFIFEYGFTNNVIKLDKERFVYKNGERIE